MRTLCTALLFLAGCDPNGSGAFGTSVGNPGKESFRLAPPGDEAIVYEHSTGFLAGQYLVGCDGSIAPVILDEDLDLLSGPAEVVPAGTWCAMVFDFERIEVELTVDAQPVAFSLSPGTTWTWWMADPLVIDGTEILIELATPGWLTGEDLPTTTPTSTEPLEDVANAGLLLERLADGGLFEDLDDDGEISEGERAIGSLAGIDVLPVGAEEVEDEEEEVDEAPRVAVDGCHNCAQTGGGPPSALVLGLAAWAVVRARRRTAA